MIGRRAFAAGLVLAPALARAQGAGDRLSFEIWRNGAHIGTHTVALRRSGGAVVASITAEMVVKLGPIPVFHYRHEATETWSGGRFDALEARTVSNGKVETVSTRYDGAALTIVRNRGSTLVAPTQAAPLTHWNREALRRPLFNPQTGVMVQEAVSEHAGDQVRAADGRMIPSTRYALVGDAQITDWYDAGGAWCGLRGKVADGSYIEYRRT